MMFGTQTDDRVVYWIYLMRFEFDPAKSATNLAKHGVDFVAGQSLRDDPDRLEIPARSADEPRFSGHWQP